MKAKVSITRRGMTKGDGVVSIQITDKESRLRVIEVEMEMIEFAEAITGLSYCKAECFFAPNQFIIDNIGKKREVKDIFVERSGLYGEKDNEIIRQSVEDSGELVDGWMIHSDGCNTQQHGMKHKVVLYRFVDAEL